MGIGLDAFRASIPTRMARPREPHTNAFTRLAMGPMREQEGMTRFIAIKAKVI
jgi:hypothetical protein